MRVSPRLRRGLLATVFPATLPFEAHAYTLGDKPSFVTQSPIVTYYDGVSDDLLTAGLGADGLKLGAPTPSVSPIPTVPELRRLAIFNNYRALVDPSTGGGFQTLYGPNVTANGTVTNLPGKVPGTEYVMLTQVSSKNSRVLAYPTVIVQIPDSYDPSHGCVVAAPSSGSRGAYGAIATAGEWGLKNHCAVAYTDKGSGMGVDDLQTNTINLVQGQRLDATAAGTASNFTALLSNAQRTTFNATNPYRFAFKHAHSQANPEADWGQYVLQSVQVAFWVLNQHFYPGSVGPYPLNKSNTSVIASSVSNGGGASLRAAEQDTTGLIDGVAVGEPNVNPGFSNAFTIQQGTNPPFAGHSKPLEDYITFENLYAGCAALNPTTPTAPLNFAASAARCTNLQANGLLSAAATTTALQAAEAQQKLNDYGILPEQNFVSPSYWFAYVHQSITVTYANAYGKFGAADALCGLTFGATATAANGSGPIALSLASESQIFGTGNGIPPTAGINLINNLGPSGPQEDRVSTPDQDLRGALCFRGLATGIDPVKQTALQGSSLLNAQRIAAGVTAIKATGALNGKPAVWVQGRNDGILPPNFTGRAYYGLINATGNPANVRFYEVTNTQHLDSFNQFAGFNNTLVPLHVYYIQAMNMMRDYLNGGTPLLPSQVVHTTPRGGSGSSVPDLTSSNVPPLVGNPGANAITFGAGVLKIPN